MSNRHENRRRRVKCRRYDSAKDREESVRRIRQVFEALENRVLLTVTQPPALLEQPFDQHALDELSTTVPESILQSFRNSGNLDQYSQAQLASTSQWVVLLEPGTETATLWKDLGVTSIGAAPLIDWAYLVEVDGAADFGELGAAPNASADSSADSSAKDTANAIRSSFLQATGVIDMYPLVSLNNVTKADPPADPFFGNQWHLSNPTPGPDTNVLDAWDLDSSTNVFSGVTGDDDGRTVVVGVVDDGVQHTHPDLLGNRWSNSGEAVGDANGDMAPGRARVDDDNDGLVDEDLNGCGVIYAENGSVSAHRDANGAFCEYVDNAQADDDENGYVDDLFGFDFRFGDNEPAPTIADGGLLNCTVDSACNAHGTSVAGIIAAVGHDPPGPAPAIGVSGVAPEARIAPIRLIGGGATDLTEAQALSYDNQDIHIYNNSWGPDDDRDYHTHGPLVGAALESGVNEGRDGLGNVFVWAAGNGGNNGGVPDRSDYDQYASSRYTIAVGAVTQTGAKASFSEAGSNILVAAGGDRIATTDLLGAHGYSDGTTDKCGAGIDPDYTVCFNGTSAAAPQVAGVVALMLDANPTLSWRDVQHILVETATKNDPSDTSWQVNQAGHDINEKYGFGFVNAAGAVDAARRWITVDDEIAPTPVTTAIGQTITNNGPAVVSEVTYPTLVSIETVEVTVDITHPHVHDLEIFLTHTSADGSQTTTSRFAEPRQPDDAQSNLQWTFTSVRHWGETSDGTWQLSVRDGRAVENSANGTLNDWTLKINGTEKVLTADEASAQLDGFNITPTGATIIVPGFEPLDDHGDTMLPFAQVIRNEAESVAGNSWLFDYDHARGGFHASQSVLPTPAQQDASGEIVLLFDWSLASRQVSEGWAESSGDALFSMLVDLELVDPATGSGVPLHVIGAGMGASVASEAVERLGYFDVDVDHLTYLDPHDFDQGLVYDSAQDFDSLAQLPGYGVAVWDNVDFADVYYQTRATNGPDLSDSLVPAGRPIPGAYNYWLNDSTSQLPDSPYDELNIFGDHEYVWAGFYLSTINGETPQANETAALTKDTPAPENAIDPNETGYVYSRLKSGELNRPDPQFFEYRDRGNWSADQLYEQFDIVSHEGSSWLAQVTHTSRSADRASGGFAPEPYRNEPGHENDPNHSEIEDNYYWVEITADQIPSAQDHTHTPDSLVATENRPDMAGLFGLGLTDQQLVESRWQSQWSPMEIANGDFSNLGDEIALAVRQVPGWSYHTESRANLTQPTNDTLASGYATLDRETPAITHNTVYVAPQAAFITVAVQVTGVSGDDELIVKLGDTELSSTSPMVLSTITADFEDIRFPIPTDLRNAAHTLTVELKNTGDFEASVRVKDVRFEGFAYGVREGDITEIDLTTLLGAGPFRINGSVDNDTYQLFFPAGENASSFSGIVYVAPKIDSTSGNHKATAPRASLSFTDTGMSQDHVMHINIVDGYSTVGEHSVDLNDTVGGGGATNELLDVLRVQQRLRYLNYRGERIGSGDAASIPEVEVTGAVNLATRQAIKLFKASVSPDGNGDPAIETDVVSPDQSAVRWLNSPDAPVWTQIRTALVNRINIGNEVWDTHWTIQKIENAHAARPELKRTTAHEEFGVNSLTEYPDEGVPATSGDNVNHPNHSHKSGLNIDVELDREALNDGDATEEQNTVDDILAFVGADGVQVRSIYVGQNSGEYASVRTAVQAALDDPAQNLPAVPDLNFATGHFHHFSIDFLPPQLDERLTANTRTNLVSVFETVRDNMARALMLMDETTHTLPLVDRSIADSIDLEQAIQIALLDRITEVFEISDTRVSDLLAGLKDVRVVDDGLIGQLQDVTVDVDKTTGENRLMVEFVFRATQLNVINGGGDLPQNRRATPDLLDPTGAAQNLAIDISFPMKLQIPLSDTVTPDEVAVEVGDVQIDASSVSIRNYDARIGLAPVKVVHDPVILEGALTTQIQSSDGVRPATLEDLADPFLVAADPTITAQTVRGVLPIEHEQCAELSGDPRVVITSDNIFVDTEANVSTTADINDLSIFASLSAADIVGGLDAAIHAIRNVTQSSLAEQITPETPLIGPAVTSIIDALNNATDFVEKFISEDSVDLPFQTLNELIDVTGLTLGIRRDSVDSLCAGNAFTLTLDYDRSFTEPVTLEPTSESLGPTNVSAGIQSELVANLSFDLDIGFLFGFTDKSESEFLNLSLSELNGGAGMRTVTGPDLELFVPESALGRTVNMTEEAAGDVVEALDAQTTIPAELSTALSGLGLTMSNSATIKINNRREEWHVEDRDNNRTWKINAIRSDPDEVASFLNDPTGFRVSGPGYLVDLTPATTVQDMFDRINTASLGKVTHELQTDDGGNVTGFALISTVADEGHFSIRPVVGVDPEGETRASQAGEDLDVLGIDLLGDGRLFGSIDTLELPDRIFFGPGSGLTLSGEFNAADIDAGVSLFGIGAEIVNGELDFDITTSLTLEDSGSGADDGRLTLRELADGPFVDVVKFSIPRVIGKGRLPLIARPDALNSEFGIDPNHPTTEEDDGPEILIDFETPDIDVASGALPRDDGLVVAAALPIVEIGGPVKLKIEGNDEFERVFQDLKNFVPDDFCEALDRIVLMLRAGDFAFMNEDIPLVNQSLNELLDPEGPLRELIGVLCPNEDDIRNALISLLPTLDNPEDPDRGAIPALLEELNDDQRAELYALRDSLGSAINAPPAADEATDEGGEGEEETTPSAATDIVARVMGVVQRFRTFLDGLPNTPAKNQMIAAIDQIADAVPNVEALEETVEDALGLETPSERMQFELEFDFNDDDKSILAIFDDYEIFGIDTTDPETDALPLDFEFGSEGDFVQLSTMGGLEGNVFAKFDLAIGFNLAPGLPISERIFFDVKTDGGDLTETKITIEAGLDATLNGDLTLGGMNAASLGLPGEPARGMLSAVETRTAGSNGNGSNLNFSWAPAIPNGSLPLAFVKVGDEIVEDLDSYTLNATGVNFTPGNAPGNGQTVSAVFLTGSPASIEIELQEPGGDGRVTLAELFAGPDADSEDVDEGFIDVTIDAGLGAHLPFSATPVIEGQVRAFVDFNDITNPGFQVDAGLSDWLDDLVNTDSCNLPALVDGINAFGEVLEDALTNEFLTRLPLIGDDLDMAGAFVSEFNDFTSQIASVTDTDSLRQLLFDTLGPPGINILRDAAGNPIGDPSMIDAEIPESGSECAHVNLRIGNTVELAAVDFDLGLDTVVFDLQTTGGLEVGFDYDIQIGFGLDIAKGAYFILNEDEADPEVELELFAELTNDAGIMVDLFFLSASASENPAPRMVEINGEMVDARTGVSGTVSLDIDGGSDNELTFQELVETPFGETFGVGLDVVAVVDLTLDAGVGDISKFPSFGVDFYFEWGLEADSNADDPFMVGDPIVEFNNFGINLGAYVSNVVSPIIKKIDEYLEPIDPLIDFLSLELPLISDVAEFLGQDPVTVVDVIALFGEGGDTAAEFIDTVIKIREIVDALAGMPGDDIRFAFGDFETLVNPREEQDLTDFLNDDALSDPGSNSPEEAEQMLEDSGMEDLGFLGEIFGFLNDIGIHFPLLEEPTTAFGALMGQPVDLVTYDFLGDRRLEAGFDWSVTFGPIIPPVPLFVEIFAEFGIFADFVIGLDTYGLQSGTFTDGLYFEDEEPVIGLTAGFGAAAELNAGLVWGGVRGGVEAEIGAGWNDVNDDGKFRIPEIIQRANQGLHCIFDLRGKMDAFVEAYAGLGINIFGAKVTIFEKTIEILRATIFEFNVGCPPLEPPVLAHVDGSDLIVHIGPNAHLRQNGATDGEDTLTIEQPTRGENAGKTVIKGFGQEQAFDGFTTIVIDAGVEVDNITIDASVEKDVEIDGGDGDDIILVSAPGTHTISGGSGNDRIVADGSEMKVTLNGNDGDDYLKGGEGDDDLFGGAGNDILLGGDGNDMLEGGDGDDEVDGGLGGDTLFGNDGNDSLTGGPTGDPSDPDVTVDGINTVEGGAGDDFLQGGNNADTLRGGAGNDTVSGNEGDDELFGDEGEDLIFGGEGDDELTGGDDDDQMEGGEGNDRYLFGPTSVNERDELAETSGSDTIDFSAVTEDVTANMEKGQARHGKRLVTMDRPTRFEHAVGGSGDDTFMDSSVDNSFQGKAGNDTYVFGNFTGTQTDSVIETGGLNSDSDTISFAAINTPIIVDLSAGNIDIAQNSQIANHTGRTVMVTTAAPGFTNGNRESIENVIGGKQADSIRGNNADNELSGRGGIDIIRGESGADTIRGGSGDDELHGDAGADSIFGDAGKDMVFGGTQGDFISGGPGDDDLFGEGGNDEIEGNGGDDFIFGAAGDDTLRGGAGFDTAWGDIGSDTIEGGQGEDRLFGEDGNDTILGGPGRDFILGHTGNDILKGGSGDDFLAGGSDTGSRLDAAVLANELTQVMLDSFGDQLDGQSGHDFIVGGQPWDDPASNVEDALVSYVSQFFYDMFVEELSPRPLFFAGEGFDNSPANFVNLYFKVEFADPGSDGDDLLHGGLANDLLVGGDGLDHLFGDWGNDVLFAYRISDVGPTPGSVSTDVLEGDRVEGGPNDDGPVCGTHTANLLIGGTSNQNLQYTLDSRPANETPPNGGYHFVTCTDEPPPLPEFERVEIQGQKFRDTNANGIRDAGEVGLPGWTIELRDTEGDLLATTVTQNIDLNNDGAIDPETESGLYWFRDAEMHEDGNVDDFVEGTYFVNEVVETGFGQTFPPIGETTPVPSGVATSVAADAPGTTGWEVLLRSGPNPGDGEIATGLDFGNAAFARISGFAWLDINGNDIREENEPPHPGMPVSLYSNLFQPPDYTEFTDEQGFYEFTSVDPNLYFLIADTAPGFESSPLATIIDPDYEDVIGGNDFAIVELGSIEGTAWHDLNANGVRDFGEPDWGDGFDLDTNGDLTVEAGPGFTVDGLRPGIYTLNADPAAGVLQSFPTAATLDQHMFLIESGTHITTADFGFYRNGRIRGRVANDINGDGFFLFDTNLTGVTVFLDHDADGELDPDEPSQVTTGPSGIFSFDNLTPGTYTVSYLVPEGREDTTPDGTTVMVDVVSEAIDPFINFGAAKSYRIDGSVFLDSNFNGLRDEGEVGLPNWLVFVDEDGDLKASRDEFNDPTERTERTLFDDPTTATTETGDYTVANLTPGLHRLVLELHPRWFATTTSTPLLNITNTDRTFEFGVHPINCDEGLTEEDFHAILDQAGFPLADINFNREVEFGDFLTLSANFNQTGDYTDGDITCDGKIDFVDFLRLSGNFGARSEQTVEIQGRKFADTNGSGFKDSDEIGLDGWTVQLHAADGTFLAETTTQSVDLDEDGFISPNFESGLYYFRDASLPDGNVTGFLPGQKYFVSVVPQEGMQLSVPLDGQTFEVPSGIAEAEERTVDGDPRVGYLVPMANNITVITDEINFGSVEIGAASTGAAAEDSTEGGDAVDEDDPLVPAAAAGLDSARTPFSYAWINNATGRGSIADPTYAFNEGGGDVVVQRSATGQYQVTFEGLGNVQTSGGHVQVSAYGGSSFCVVNNWGRSGSNFNTNVSCFDADGSAADTQFNVAVIHPDNEAGVAYAWANNATARSYVPNTQFSSSPGPISISRSGTGAYSVSFSQTRASGGHVQVTSYGSAATRCSVGRFTGTTTFTATVNCVAPNGRPVDSQFAIAMIQSPNAAGPYVGYAWADDADGQNYEPNTTYSSNPSRQAIQADQISTGRYEVSFKELNPSSRPGGHIQVTAYGDPTNYCNVVRWANNEGTTTATIGCFNTSGRPVNTQFEIMAVATLLGDRFEPNDNIGIATDLGTGDQRHDGLSILTCGGSTEFCSENDYFRWTATFSGSLNVQTRFAVSGPRLDNIDLQVLDEKGQVLGSSTSTTANESVTLNVVAGQSYLIRVFGVAGWDNDDYDLIVNGPEINPDRFEENDTRATAAELPAGDGRYADLNIHAANNDDWFSWQSPVTGLLTLTAGFLQSNGNLDMELFDDADNRLALANSTTSNEVIQSRVQAGRRYFFRIFGVGGITHPGYVLAADVPNIGEDRFEENDSFEKPADLGTGDRKERRLTIHDGPPGTEFTSNPDWFRWTAPADGKLAVDILFRHADGDLTLQLLDAERNVLANSATRTDNESAALEVRAGDSYWIHVFGVAGATHPNYDLCIEFESNPGSISGTKYDDLDADGMRDFEPILEPGLPGVTIYIDLNNNSRLDPNEPSTITGPRGDYRFTGLEAGTYVVREIVPDGWTQTAPVVSFDVTTYPVSDESFSRITDIVSADFNADGFDDLAVGLAEVTSTLFVAAGNAAGQLADPLEVPGESGGNLILAEVDFNGDGVPDLAYADDKLLAIRSFANGNFDTVNVQGIPSPAVDMVAADFNNDGFDDLAIAWQSGGVGVLLGTGNGSFEEVQRVEVPGFLRALDAGDFDNDGLPEVVVASVVGEFSARVTLLQNSLGDPGELAIATVNFVNSSLMHAVDWQQDGFLDIGITPGTLLGSVNTATSGFITGEQIATPFFGALDSADFTDNNYPDAVSVFNPGNFRRVRILRNDEGQGFGKAFDLPVFVPGGGEYAMNLVEVGDLNGDGNPDIISSSDFLAAIHVFLASDKFSHRVTLDAGENANGRDFGNARGGSISGIKYESVDCMGPYDAANDGRLAGFTIYVDLNDNGQLDPNEPFDVTDENGAYLIENVPIGTWSVREVQQEGYQQAFPESGRHVVTIDRSNGRARNINFGNFMQEQLADGADRIFGYSGNDLIFGDNAVTDPCIENAGDDDELHGMQDNDIIAGQQRNDTYFFDINSGDDGIVELEGAGTNDITDHGIADRLDFTGLTESQSAIVNLSGVTPFVEPLRIAEFGERTGTAPVTITTAGSIATTPGGHEFFEQLIGGPGDDVLVANDRNNLLDGRGGADLQQGGAGDDIYSFGLDSGSGDQLIETIGSDTLDFSRFTDRNVIVDLIAGTAQHSGGAITIDNPELFENVIGAQFEAVGDTITGNSDDNILAGTLGDDQLNGKEGNDLLIGGLGNDNFIYEDNWGEDVVVELPAGGTLDQLDFSAVTDDLTFTVGTQIDVTDGLNTLVHLGLEIENLLGGSGSNTLAGGPGSNTWVIDGVNSGTLNGVRFTNIANLVGGPDEDLYLFEPGGQLTGDLQSGSGDDTIDLRLGGTIGGFINGESGNDSILAADENRNAFTLTNDNAGTIAVTSPEGVPVTSYSFESVENLTGGQYDDTFAMNAFGLSGIADGLGGDDLLQTDPINPTSTIVTQVGGGRLFDAANNPLGRFANIEDLTGGAANDRYAVSGGSIRGQIDGGGGTNLLAGDDTPYQFDVLTANAGQASSIGSFVNIQHLRGGAMNDTFNLADPTLASVDGGGGIDEIVAPDVANLVTINGPNAGDINGVTFTNVESITGNSQSDTFQFAGGELQGTVNGADGTDRIVMDDRSTITDIFNVNSGRISPSLNPSQTITQFEDIEQIDAGNNDDALRIIFGTIDVYNAGNGNDFLAAGSTATTYELSGNNQGSATQIGNFTSVENLIGGSSDDTFIMNGHVIDGFLSGAAGNDTFDLSAGGSASGIDGGIDIDELIAEDAVSNVFDINGLHAGTLNGLPYAGIENLTGGELDDAFNFISNVTAQFVSQIDGGGGMNSIQLGPNNNLFQITNIDAGNGTGVDSFSNVGSLLGNTLDDEFEIAGGSLSGSIAGNLGNDTLRGTNSPLIFTVTGPDAGEVSAVAGGFVEIENILGSTDEDTFNFLTGGSISGGSIFGLAGNDVFVISPTTGTTHLFDGGDDEDSITIDAGAGVPVDFQLFGTTFVNIEPGGISVRYRNMEEAEILCDTCDPAPAPAAEFAVLAAFAPASDDVNDASDDDDEVDDFATIVDAIFRAPDEA